MNEVNLNKCVFLEPNAAISFAEKKSNKFHIVAYSGGVILNHWFWGNVAFDLKGVKFSKNCVPVLESHDRSKRIGFSTKTKIDKTIEVTGQFLDNQVAQELKRDIEAGFPMEASVLIVPSDVEEVREGSSTLVNGHRLEGPGNVFRKGTIKEVSMCSFGADSNTSSKSLAADGAKSLAANVNADAKIEYSISEKPKAVTKMTKREQQIQDGKNALMEIENKRLAFEAQLKREFEQSSDLQKEFGDVETYMAYKKAEARGLIRGILK